jgi:hypothetical protein
MDGARVRFAKGIVNQPGWEYRSLGKSCLQLSQNLLEYPLFSSRRAHFDIVSVFFLYHPAPSLCDRCSPGRQESVGTLSEFKI